MNIQYYEVNKLPVAVIDEIYNGNEIDDIMEEIKFLSKRDKFKDPGHTRAATREIVGKENSELKKVTEISLKKNLGLFLDNSFNDRNLSDILFHNRKVFLDKQINEFLINCNPHFRVLSRSDYDTTLISYYEDGDYYHNHTDSSALTIITWFFNQPKKFTGGNLVIEDELEIECKFNRSVIFPGLAFHKVTKVEMKEEDKGKQLGRYTMSQFANIKF